MREDIFVGKYKFFVFLWLWRGGGGEGRIGVGLVDIVGFENYILCEVLLVSLPLLRIVS